ncbi:hypothetical protein E4T42_06072 [Aureobasidium subglaciale]|nr:hypothetical protein E4T42_06072 [Aureobasidium subglaciale]
MVTQSFTIPEDGMELPPDYMLTTSLDTFVVDLASYNKDPEVRTGPLTMTGGNANSSYLFDAQQRSRLTGAIYNFTATFLTLYNSDDITEAQASDARMFNLMTVIQGRDNSDVMLRPFLNAEVMMERAAQVFNAIGPESLPFANTSAAEGAQINAIVPGVRARLDCIPTSNRTVYHNMDFGRDKHSKSVTTRVPVNVLNTCVGHPMPSMLSTNITFSVYPEETYFAQITNLHIFQASGGSSPVSDFPNPNVGTFTYPHNDADCPSLVFYIAKWSPLPSSKDYMLDFNALSCKQVVDEVQVNATLLYPSMELDPLIAPKVLEGVTTNVVDTERNGSVETWQVGYQFDKWDTSQIIVTGGTSRARNQQVSRYYQMVVNGTREVRPVPLDHMIGEANIDNFSKATQGLYGIYTAQLLSTKKQDLFTPTSVQASIEAMTEWRDKQHEPSKIVLQVILGIMAVCGLLKWLCMETKEVLPHNPCTIAGVSMGWYERHNDDEESSGDVSRRHFGIDRSRRK